MFQREVYYKYLGDRKRVIAFKVSMEVSYIRLGVGVLGSPMEKPRHRSSAYI